MPIRKDDPIVTAEDHVEAITKHVGELAHSAVESDIRLCSLLALCEDAFLPIADLRARHEGHESDDGIDRAAGWEFRSIVSDDNLRRSMASKLGAVFAEVQRLRNQGVGA